MLPRCSPLLPRAPSLLPRAPPQPLPSLQLLLRSCKFKRERPFSLLWMLIREEPVLAPPTAHHVIFCSYPLALSLLLFLSTSDCLRPAASHLCTQCAIVYVVVSYSLYISRPLCVFALYFSVAGAFLSCYNSRLNLDSNGKQKEDCSAVL